MNEPASADLIVVGASELVTCAGPAPARGTDQSRVGVVPEGAVAALGGRISWVGPQTELESEVVLSPGAKVIDVGGRAVLPGLVDPHTHLVYAGSRADEFEQRLAGDTYEKIAERGGGILRTVERTRATSLRDLARMAGERMDRLSRSGATSIEVKSGYGLALEHEVKILEAAKQAATGRPLEIVNTFLGAHTFPRSARKSATARNRYVDQLAREMIPLVAERQLARFVDVFIDDHAFRELEARRVLRAARDSGLAVKVHADQLANDGGAKIAAEFEATSADHLEHTDDSGLEALAAAGTVAVLIPGASLFLRMSRYGDGRRMISLGVPVALATDLNPGTCPCASLPLVMQLGCLLCGLTIDEAIVASTLNAAAAAGIEDRAGSIEPGKRCDLLVLEGSTRQELLYELGSARIFEVIAAGQPLLQ